MNPSSGLTLDVEGKVGATDYCDENGENCFTAGGVGGGSAAAAGPEGAIQFNNSSALDGNANFVYTADGRLGIGTSAPTVALDVNGNIKGSNFFAGDTMSIGINSSSDSNTIVIGNNIIGSNSGIYIGNNITPDDNTSAEGRVVIGTDAVQGGNKSVVIGYKAQGSNNSIAIGHNSRAIHQHSIVLGADATSTGSSQFVAGSNGTRISQVFFGRGVAHGQPGGYTINGTGGSGTNIAGGYLNLAGGRATGNAAGGSIAFQTSNALGSGSNLQSLSTKMIITPVGNVGIGKSDPAYPLDVAGDIALTGQIHDVSDRRLKSHIKPLDAGQLKKLLTLQGVSFVMQESDQTELGLIAQDVEPHFPELVQTRSDGMKTLSYLGFIAPMIEAFKEQQTQLELLQEQVELLQAQLQQISSQSQPE